MIKGSNAEIGFRHFQGVIAQNFEPLRALHYPAELCSGTIAKCDDVSTVTRQISCKTSPAQCSGSAAVCSDFILFTVFLLLHEYRHSTGIAR
jgi:hypothetical protein